jgi:hypothetical protein
VTSPTPNLAHLQQQRPYGCLWHAAYAVTRDERLLDNVAEACLIRRHLIALAHGWMINPIFQDTSTDTAARVPVRLWSMLLELARFIEVANTLGEAGRAGYLARARQTLQTVLSAIDQAQTALQEPL